MPDSASYRRYSDVCRRNGHLDWNVGAIAHVDNLLEHLNRLQLCLHWGRIEPLHRYTCTAELTGIVQCEQSCLRYILEQMMDRNIGFHLVAIRGPYMSCEVGGTFAVESYSYLRQY